MTEGDVRPWFPRQFATVEGYWPDGSGGNKTWQGHGAWGGATRGTSPQWDRSKTEKMQYPLWFEIGHHFWPDAGFDYFLAQMRGPDDEQYIPTLYFGIEPIDPAKVTPPAPVCSVYPERGFVMLYHDTSPGGWESNKPAVGLRLASPYAHHVNDSLAIVNYYALGRLIYMNPAPDPGYKFKFSRSIRSHTSVMIDGHIARQDWGNTGSVEPGFTYDLTTRHDFSPEAKFVAARTAKRYPGVDETRTLILTEPYLLDIFRCRGTERHSFMWVAHTFGTAEVPDKQAWRPSTELADTLISPQFINVLSKQTGDKPWSVSVRQVPVAEVKQNDRYSAWWKRTVGVKVHMLGQDGATAFVANSQNPYSNNPRKPVGPRLVDGVAVLATRWDINATFVALHEPFEDQPKLSEFRLINQTDDAIAVAVVGEGFSDRLMVRFDDKAEQPITLSDGKESYTFKGFAFVRTTPRKVTVRGNLISNETKK